MKQASMAKKRAKAAKRAAPKTFVLHLRISLRTRDALDHAARQQRRTRAGMTRMLLEDATGTIED
jgi:hypothetical protein